MPDNIKETPKIDVSSKDGSPPAERELTPEEIYDKENLFIDDENIDEEIEIEW